VSSTRPTAATTEASQDEVAAHLKDIDRDGYSVIEDVIAPEHADRIAAHLLEIERKHGIVPSRNAFEGRQTVRVYNLLVHGSLCEEIPVHPRVLPVVEGVLDPGCLISSLSSVSIGPGEAAQMIHSDDQLIPLPKPHPAIVCNTMWALTDFTEENGATRLVPGSHRSQSPDVTQRPASIPAVLRKGSVLIWNGSLWHGGGANRSDRRRVGIAANYCAGWMRQQENQQLGIPRDVARHFPPRLRALVGYGVYRHLIGHIEKKSPDYLLGEDGALRTVWDERP
jgi:ectoine hydroxylase-related dioxygenase (phytanoyl-CoA dioxygenase family)